MENQNKKTFSTILMAVGVLCIVVSGGIFVSRTWQYLPEMVKKLCLVAVAAGFFGGSAYLEKRTSLKKAPLALYYLGVSFTGFSVLSLMPADGMRLAGRMIIAMLAMSIPVIWRFVKEKGLADLIVQICLTDGMLICIAQYGDLDKNCAMAICLATITMVLAGFIYYCKRDLEEEKGLITTSIAAYWFHVILVIPYLIEGIFVGRDFLLGVVPMFLVTGSVTALYLAYQSTGFRVCQSVMLLMCGLSLSAFFVTNLPDGTVAYEVPLVFFAAFVIGLVLMVVLGREELLYVNGGLGLFYTLIQNVEYANFVFEEGARPLCYPFGICMAVAIVFWYFFREKNWDQKGFWEIGGTYFVIGLHTLTGWFWGEYASHYGVVVWMALACLLAAFMMEQRSEKALIPAALCKSFSLFFALVAFLSHKILPVVFYAEDGMRVAADFNLEYDCIFAGVGIVLLGIIWYSIYQEIRTVQFIGVCILLGVLLLNNFSVAALPNVLFLGILTFVMLVVATVLKNKRYAIASAGTLALIVLYMTRQFWMSIAWWVYLFVAGVVLVIFAIKKEKAE